MPLRCSPVARGKQVKPKSAPERQSTKNKTAHRWQGVFAPATLVRAVAASVAAPGEDALDRGQGHALASTLRYALTAINVNAWSAVSSGNRSNLLHCVQLAPAHSPRCCAAGGTFLELFPQEAGDCQHNHFSHVFNLVELGTGMSILAPLTSGVSASVIPITVSSRIPAESA